MPTSQKISEMETGTQAPPPVPWKHRGGLTPDEFCAKYHKSFSPISWTNCSWNPWRGCVKVAAECKHCYIDRKMCGDNPFGEVLLVKKWKGPYKWQEDIPGGYNLKCFTCSISDFFIDLVDGRELPTMKHYSGVADRPYSVTGQYRRAAVGCNSKKWRDCAWQVMKDTPNVTYQILTKRPDRILQCLPKDWNGGWPNVWLGTSVGCKATLGKLDELRKVPVHPKAVRFISHEPLLEDISQDVNWDGIGWVIVGGETGIGVEYMHGEVPPAGGARRTMKVEWAHSLLQLARRQNIPFWFKQMSGPTQGMGADALGEIYHECPAPSWGKWLTARAVPAKAGRKTAEEPMMATNKQQQQDAQLTVPSVAEAKKLMKEVSRFRKLILKLDDILPKVKRIKLAFGQHGTIGRYTSFTNWVEKGLGVHRTTVWRRLLADERKPGNATKKQSPKTAPTVAEWDGVKLPSPTFKKKYFQEASETFKDRYQYAFKGSAFKRVLAALGQVTDNAEDFTQLATVLRAAANHAGLLAKCIDAALKAGAEANAKPAAEFRKEEKAENVNKAKANGKARKADLELVYAWGKDHSGSVKEVRAQCPGLSSYKHNYVMSLLEELAASGRIKVTEVPRRRLIGQYTLVTGKANGGAKPAVVTSSAAPADAKRKRWFKVGSDSRTLGIGSKDDRREAAKLKAQFAITGAPAEPVDGRTKTKANGEAEKKTNANGKAKHGPEPLTVQGTAANGRTVKLKKARGKKANGVYVPGSARPNGHGRAQSAPEGT